MSDETPPGLPPRWSRPVDDDQVVNEQLRLSTNARDTGMAAAVSADAPWSDRVLAWIGGLERGTELDADDVRSNFGASPAVGSVFHAARRSGLITCIGFTESRSIQRRRGLQRVWRRT